jgi:hypothetical protein
MLSPFISNFKDFLVAIKNETLEFTNSRNLLKIYCLYSNLEKEDIFEYVKGRYEDTEYCGKEKDFFRTDIYKNKKVETSFFVYKADETPLVLILSFTPKSKVDRILESIIKQIPDSYFLWINPTDFNNIKEKILDDYPDAKITSFIGTREPHYRNICNLRPDFHRRIEYSGGDGIDTLREMKEEYGVLPKKIGFYVTNQIKFSMDYRNTFIIEKGYSYLDNILDIIKTSLELNTKINSVLEKVKVEEVVSEDRSKDLILEPLIIQFNAKKTYEDLELFFRSLENLTEDKYCLINSYVKQGSLFFSGTVLDESKDSLFSFSGNEEKMVVVPKKRCKFDSLSRFYEKVVLSLDLEAIPVGEQNGRE